MVFHPIEGPTPEPAHADKTAGKVERADAAALQTDKVLADIMPPKLGADKGNTAPEERLGEGPGRFMKMANANAGVMLNQLLAEHGTERNVQEAFWPFTSSSPKPGSDDNTRCPDGTQRQNNSCDSHTGGAGHANPVIVPRAGSSPSDSGTSGTRGGTSGEGAAGEGAHGTGGAGEGAHGGASSGAHGGFGGGAHGGGGAS